MVCILWYPVTEVMLEDLKIVDGGELLAVM